MSHCNFNTLSTFLQCISFNPLRCFFPRHKVNLHSKYSPLSIPFWKPNCYLHIQYISIFSPKQVWTEAQKSSCFSLRKIRDLLVSKRRVETINGEKRPFWCGIIWRKIVPETALNLRKPIRLNVAYILRRLQYSLRISKYEVSVYLVNANFLMNSTEYLSNK